VDDSPHAGALVTVAVAVSGKPKIAECDREPVEAIPDGDILCVAAHRGSVAVVRALSDADTEAHPHIDRAGLVRGRRALGHGQGRNPDEGAERLVEGSHLPFVCNRMEAATDATTTATTPVTTTACPTSGWSTAADSMSWRSSSVSE